MFYQYVHQNISVIFANCLGRVERLYRSILYPFFNLRCLCTMGIIAPIRIELRENRLNRLILFMKILFVRESDVDPWPTLAEKVKQAVITVGQRRQGSYPC